MATLAEKLRADLIGGNEIALQEPTQQKLGSRIRASLELDEGLQERREIIQTTEEGFIRQDAQLTKTLNDIQQKLTDLGVPPDIQQGVIDRKVSGKPIDADRKTTKFGLDESIVDGIIGGAMAAIQPIAGVGLASEFMGGLPPMALATDSNVLTSMMKGKGKVIEGAAAALEKTAQSFSNGVLRQGRRLVENVLAIRFGGAKLIGLLNAVETAADLHLNAITREIQRGAAPDEALTIARSEILEPKNLAQDAISGIMAQLSFGLASRFNLVRQSAVASGSATATRAGLVAVGKELGVDLPSAVVETVAADLLEGRSVEGKRVGASGLMTGLMTILFGMRSVPPTKQQIQDPVQRDLFKKSIEAQPVITAKDLPDDLQLSPKQQEFADRFRDQMLTEIQLRIGDLSGPADLRKAFPDLPVETLDKFSVPIGVEQAAAIGVTARKQLPKGTLEKAKEAAREGPTVKFKDAEPGKPTKPSEIVRKAPSTPQNDPDIDAPVLKKVKGKTIIDSPDPKAAKTKAEAAEKSHGRLRSALSDKENLQLDDAIKRFNKKILKVRVGIPGIPTKEAVEIGTLLIKAGARTFQDFVKQITQALGRNLTTKQARALFNRSIKEFRSKQTPQERAFEAKNKVFSHENAAPTTTAKKLFDEVAAIRSTRKEISRLQTKELGRRALEVERIRGEARGNFEQDHIRALSALKGPLPTKLVDPIGPKFAQHERNGLLRHVLDHPALRGKNQTFREVKLQSTIRNFLDNGAVPTKGQIVELEKVFGTDIGQSFRKLGVETKLSAKQLAREAVGLTRALKSTLDVSYGLRQGFTNLFSNPVLWGQNFVTSIKALGSENVAQAVDLAIRNDPNFDLRQASGVAYSPLDGSFELSALEEMFANRMFQRWANIDLKENGGLINVLKKVTGIPTRASERAWVTFMNKFRADIFDGQVKNLVADSPHLNPRTSGEGFAIAQRMARFGNTTTGRGNLSKSGALASEVASWALFAPRFLWSRVEYFPRVAHILAVGTKTERIQVSKQLLGKTALFMTLGTLADNFGDMIGVDISFGSDWRDPTFGKIRIGDEITIDMAAGYGQVIRLLANVMTGSEVDPVTGRKKDKNEVIAAARFLRNKASPIASTILSVKNPKAESFGKLTGDENVFETSAFIAKSLFAPISVETVLELHQTEDAKALALILPELVGLGVNVREQRQRR